MHSSGWRRKLNIEQCSTGRHMVQREIGWRDMFSFPGSMTPLTEALTLAESYCSDKRAEWDAAYYGMEVKLGLGLS